jgi:DNA-binding transcriptional ArsR family regulator
MVEAMRSKLGNPVRKLVLIKLADNANDKGECWPSYQNIADHCEVDKRTVMRHIKALEESGYLVKENRVRSYGNTSNMYTLSLPSDSVSPPSNPVSLPPSDSVSPRISQSFKSVNKNQSDIYSKYDFSLWPDKPNEELFKNWIDHRKAKKAKVTKLVMDQIGKQLTIAKENGFTVDQCLTEWIYNNWQGFKASWMKHDETAAQPKDYANIPIAEIANEYKRLLSQHTGYYPELINDKMRSDIARIWNGDTQAQNISWWVGFFSTIKNKIQDTPPQFMPKMYKFDRLVGFDFDNVINELR